jgi:polar amino acid transport system substrate-binding protein
MMKKIGVLVSCLFLVLLVGCEKSEQKGSDQWPRIKKEKKVIVGLDDTFAPMGFKEKNGKIVGFDVDLARATFKHYGIKVDFKSIDWDVKEKELENKTIDLIWNGYSKNEQREKVQLFSEPYMRNDQVLVVARKSGINFFEQMKGKNLGTQRGSASYDALMNQPKVLKTYINEELVLYDEFNSGFLDLEAGRVNGLLVDKVFAKYYLNQASKLKKYRLIEGEFKSEDFAVGARKSDKELIAKINESLNELHKNGKFQKISKKWFGDDVWPKKG